MKDTFKKIFIICLIVLNMVTLLGTGRSMAAITLNVIGSKPDSNNRIINIDENMMLVFNRNIQKTEKFGDITLRDINNIMIPITCKINGDVLIIDPNYDLEQGKYYIAKIPYNAVKDEAGEYLTKDFELIVVTAGDYTKPSIDSMKPANQSKDIDTKSIITVKFTEKIRAGVDITGIELIYGSNKKFPINVGINNDALTIKPLKELENNTTYVLMIPNNAIIDLSGNNLGSSEVCFFTTKTITNTLTVLESNPTNNAKYIQINEPIQVNFNENIIADVGLDSIVVKDKNGTVPTTFSVYNRTLYIFPKNGLNFAYNTTYTVNIPVNAVKGISGATSKSTYTINFTTDGQMQNPKIVNASPQNGVEGLSVRSNIKLTFSEKIKAGENIKNIIIKDEQDKIIPYDVTVSNEVMTIEPLISLEYNTSYTYVIPYGAVVNYSNTPLKQEYKYGFKTTIEKFAPLIITNYPKNGGTNVTVDGGVTIVFNEDVVKGDNFEYVTLRDQYYNELPVNRELNGKTLKLNPIINLNLDYNTKFFVTVPYGAVKDVWNNPLQTTSIFNFTTGYERFCPIIKHSNPAAGSSGVSIKPSLEIMFNDEMQKGDNFNDIVIKDNEGNTIKANTTVEADKIVVKPLSNLDYNTNYTLTIPVGAVMDKWGGVAKNNYSLNFKTEKEVVAPIVKSISPIDGGRGISNNGVFTVIFSESIIKSKTINKLVLTNGNLKNVPLTTEILGNKLTIKPVKLMDYDSSYTLRIPKDAVTDKSLNELKSDVIINISTKVSVVNKDALEVGAVKITTNYSDIAVVFNKNVTSGKNIKKLLLKDGSGKVVLTQMILKNNTITLKPKTILVPGTRYILIVPSTSVKDAQGKTMINQYSFSFIRK